MAVLCNGIKTEKEKQSVYVLNNQIPIPQRSVVSFVDILGYSNMVLKAKKEKRTDKFLYHVRRALFAASACLKTEDPCYAFNFTDSVAMGWPIEKDDDSEVPLCISCWKLAEYQLTMSYYGLFIRGGVSVGEAYFDEYVQSGEAFLVAYDIEEHRAIYPRIILSEEAVAEAKINCGYYSDKHCPLNQLFAIDADGAIFINYLSSVFEIFNPNTSRQDIKKYIAKHRSMIERNLKATANLPNVYRKYQWVARYHDFFCEEISEWLEDDLSITVDYKKERFAPPHRLLDVFPDRLS